MVAHRTLTPFVRVRILHPLPKTGCPLDNRFFYDFVFFRLSKNCQAKSYGGKKSVKGNRQGFLSRQITRRSGRIAKSCYKILFCNSESSLSKESKGAVASSQRPAGSQAAHSEFKIPSHIVPAASPPGLFPFTALHIIENYGIFSVKILTKKLRGDMLGLT